MASLLGVCAGLVTDVAGVAAPAAWLGASRSRMALWRGGTEHPGFRHALMLIDFDDAISRALLIWHPRVALDWLTSSNSCLDGARPVDAVTLGHVADVIDALEALGSGPG